MTGCRMLLFAAVAACGFTPRNAAGEPAWPTQLQAIVAKKVARFDGRLHLYVKDVQSGAYFAHNADKSVYLASGIKIFVLLAVFEAEHNGRLSFDERLVFSEDDVRDGVTFLPPDMLGAAVPIETLVRWMMHKSDNAATDMLIKRVGIKEVNRVARKYAGPETGEITSMLGVRCHIYRQLDPRVDRLSAYQMASLVSERRLSQRVKRFARLIGDDAGDRFTFQRIMSAYRSFYAAGYNSAPVKSVGQLFEALDRGKVIDPVASTRMLDIMLDCHTGEARIRAGLPAGVLLAHKTGTQLKRVCDLGMFYKPDMQSVVFTACLEEFGSRKKAEKLLASLATSTYRLVTRPVRERPAVSEKTRALESAPPEAVTRSKQAPETTVMPEIPLVPITP